MTTPNVDLSGKTALITGASRGIGAAIAKSYASAGAHVILIARSTKKLEAVDDEIRSNGGSATLMPLNLLKLDDLDVLGATLFERFGGLDIFVGNAGMLGTLGPLTHTDAKEWAQVLDVNLNANFRLIRTLDPLLQQSDAGRAIFVSTGASVTCGRAYWGSYAVSKAAMESLVKTYAAENENKALRINIIDPGAVRTDMRGKAKPGEDPTTLPAADEIMPRFLELASASCNAHGQIFQV